MIKVQIMGCENCKKYHKHIKSQHYRQSKKSRGRTGIRGYFCPQDSKIKVFPNVVETYGDSFICFGTPLTGFQNKRCKKRKIKNGKTMCHKDLKLGSGKNTNKLGCYEELDFKMYQKYRCFNTPNVQANRKKLKKQVNPNLKYLSKPYPRIWSSINLCPGLCDKCTKHPK